MPAIGREFFRAAVYHVLKFWIAKVFSVKYENHTPKITFHCVN